jgi:pilus assembly protein Flp/PilA
MDRCNIVQTVNSAATTDSQVMANLRESPAARSGAHMSRIARFFQDESGATAIEYGLIAAGLSVAIVVVVQTLGTNLNATFTTVANALK